MKDLMISVGQPGFSVSGPGSSSKEAVAQHHRSPPSGSYVPTRSMVTFAVCPRKRVPHHEMEGDVPTVSTGGRFTNSNSRVSLTQFPSESHTSRMIE